MSDFVPFCVLVVFVLFFLKSLCYNAKTSEREVMKVVEAVEEVEFVSLKDILVSAHAAERFCHRWVEVTGKKLEPGSVIAFLKSQFLSNLRQATQAESYSLRTKRQDGRFFLWGDWVFVCDDALTTVITIFYRDPERRRKM